MTRKSAKRELSLRARPYVQLELLSLYSALLRGVSHLIVLIRTESLNVSPAGRALLDVHSIEPVK